MGVPFHELVRREGVAPNFEFLLPVIIAAQRGHQLEAPAAPNTTAGVEFAGEPVRLALDHATGDHVLYLAGGEYSRGDAWDTGVDFYALVGWQHAAMLAEEALASAPGGEALLASLHEWKYREPE